jgi:predicted RNase H-like nuclease (RuvC/YqgF family)
MSIRSYNMTDDARSQRSNAASARWAKADFVKNINCILPKLKLHLDDQLRLNEIGQCVKQIFSYDDITNILYSAEHSAFLEAHDASMKQELDSVKATQETQVAELQSEIKHLHAQLDSAQRECESLRTPV